MRLPQKPRLSGTAGGTAPPGLTGAPRNAHARPAPQVDKRPVPVYAGAGAPVHGAASARLRRWTPQATPHAAGFRLGTRARPGRESGRARAAGASVETGAGLGHGTERMDENQLPGGCVVAASKADAGHHGATGGAGAGLAIGGSRRVVGVCFRGVASEHAVLCASGRRYCGLPPPCQPASGPRVDCGSGYARRLRDTARDPSTHAARLHPLRPTDA